VMEIEVNSAVDNPLVFLKSAHAGADAPSTSLRTGHVRPVSEAPL
jgi:histidine ammonia-lyase